METNSFNIAGSIFWGLLCVILLFVISLLLVLGAKTILDHIKSMIYGLKNLPSEKEIKARKRPEKKVPAPKGKPIRSIEINPDEVDRIYVKKFPD